MSGMPAGERFVLRAFPLRSVFCVPLMECVLNAGSWKHPGVGTAISEGAEGPRLAKIHSTQRPTCYSDELRACWRESPCDPAGQASGWRC